jgi:hypothetical protein
VGYEARWQATPKSTNGARGDKEMPLKDFNVNWEPISEAFSITCQQHSAPGELVSGDGITMFCAQGTCILGSWTNMEAYEKELAEVKTRIKNSPLTSPKVEEIGSDEVSVPSTGPV